MGVTEGPWDGAAEGSENVGEVLGFGVGFVDGEDNVGDDVGESDISCGGTGGKVIMFTVSLKYRGTNIIPATIRRKNRH